MRCQALRISGMLRAQGIPTETEVLGRKITKALEDADRRKMRYAILVGEKETKEETVVIRDLSKREQKTVRIDEAIDIIKKTECSNLD
jgi:histidyl-tRNA synthetase